MSQTRCSRLTTYNLALKHFCPTIQAAEVLLNAYTSHSDLLQDLMEATKDPDLDVTVKTIEADPMDLKNMNRSICRMTTVRNAFMEALTIKRKTNCLTESDILPESTEQSDLDALRVYVAKLDASVEILRCTELTELYKGLCDREDLLLKGQKQQW